MSSTPQPRAAGGRITLLTDFGTADGYVAAMKGVIAAIAPDVLIDDAGHDIPPGDIRAGSWALSAYWHLYPPGTVHIAVVDPGVGTDRRSIAIEVESRVIIVPDNGLLSGVLRTATPSAMVEIRNPQIMRTPISATFHGRDVFAPAGAHAACGMPLQQLGPALTDPVLLAATEIARTGDSVIGAIVHIDRFGNLITDIPAAGTQGGMVEVLGGTRVPVRGTYADVESGACVATRGSRGCLEIAVRDGSAAEMLGLRRGSPVVYLADLAPDI